MLTLSYDRKEPAFPSHLWILSKMLVSTEFNISEKVFYMYIYILAMCCRKIHRRLASPQSTPFLEALKAVKEFTYNIKPVATPASPAETRRQKQMDKIENLEDHRILTAYISQVIHANPALFPQKFPGLAQTAEEYVANNDSGIMLYNKSTCSEFHRLLLELLKNFQDILATLCTMSRNALALDQPVEDTMGFFRLLLKGRIYACLLMRIARSRALRMHLQNIEPLLASHIRASPSPTSAPGADTLQDHDETRDNDLEAIELDSEMDYDQKGLLAKSFTSWLLLMLIQVDAVERLVGFVHGPSFRGLFNGINVKLLIPPTTSRRLLPWRELFDDPTLFPSTALSSTMTNTKIKENLTTAIQTAESKRQYHSFATHLAAAWQCDKPIAKTIEAKANFLEFAKVPHTGNKPNILRLLNVPGEFQDLLLARGKSYDKWSIYIDRKNADDRRITAIIEEIVAECSPLTSNDFFYLEFQLQNTFQGRQHCEAYLASLLPNFTKSVDLSDHVSEKLIEDMKVCYSLF